MKIGVGDKMEVSCLLNDAGRPFVGSELRNNLVLRDSKMQLKRRLIASCVQIKPLKFN